MDNLQIEKLMIMLEGKSEKEKIKILKELGLLKPSRDSKGNLSSVDNKEVAEMANKIKSLIKEMNALLKEYSLEASLCVKKKIRK